MSDVAKLYTTDTLKQAGYGLHNEEKKTMETRAIEEDEDGDILFQRIEYKECVGHTLVPDSDDPASARLASLEKLHSLAMAAL